MKTEAQPARTDSFVQIEARVALLVLVPIGLVLLVTGVALVRYYAPVEALVRGGENGLESIPASMVLRNVHRWATRVGITLLGLHLLVVAVTRWTVGRNGLPAMRWKSGLATLVVLALMLVSGLCFPWDQLYQWAVTVGSDQARSASGGPFADLVGINARYDMRSYLAPSSTPVALWAFFVGHCLVLPLIAIVSNYLHFRRRTRRAAAAR